MANLFGDFSFDAPSPSPSPALAAHHEAERALMNCSPTSRPATPQHPYSRPLTPPPCTMGDLAQLLGGQKLFISTSRAHHIPAGPPTPPSDDDTFPAGQQASRPTYCRASASIMRMQRQAHSRLQCCSSQARDISQLVRMIEQEEQCCVSGSASCSPSTSSLVAGSAGDDEGIGMDYDCPLRVTEPLFSRPLYRAGDRHNDSVRVSKHVRMRKRSSTAKDVQERRKTK
ncbi:uncharacterized protein EKO05_0003658 [Ascochyta rabiei]|uniref:uncharacterized protein n=1 Tax=Didymella rabiei TaxID=5454 RepID=UPI00220CB92A|nr:uncharacterized protein EKO05_0003658 [Ascochyta rabiei]UPX13132.1 hypothetical protein EKO05_0003658 [Ascochyta rabiei]